MRLPKPPTLIRRLRDARVRQLAARCPPLAASLGRQAGGGFHVTLKVQGKTRTVYVPKDLKKEVEASIQEHRRLRRLLREIKASKQDCELKAFARLAGRLHQDFPQLRLCLLLDALYANGPVFDLCKQYRWKFIVTFAAGHAHALAALECREEARGESTRFAWLTNFRVDTSTVTALGNRGGRLRWKIENEGFNIQKNGGFALEHAYGNGPWAIKNFYLLMQLAHRVLQLIERGSLRVGRCQTLFGSLRALGRRLAESLRHQIIDADALDVAAAARIQIRLSPS